MTEERFTFLDTETHKTFVVTKKEYQDAFSTWRQTLQESDFKLRLIVPFELKGHRQWIYKIGEDYSDDITN